MDFRVRYRDSNCWRCLSSAGQTAEVRVFYFLNPDAKRSPHLNYILRIEWQEASNHGYTGSTVFTVLLYYLTYSSAQGKAQGSAGTILRIVDSEQKADRSP